MVIAGPGKDIGGAAVGLVLWKLWVQRQTTAKEDTGWKLGPWPVNPARMTTPQELIWAFEYLSLLRFGRAAVTWNHRDVAAGLGRDVPEFQQAAAHVAALYERARYAPVSDSLNDEAVIAARHDLCFLAGVPVA